MPRPVSLASAALALALAATIAGSAASGGRPVVPARTVGLGSAGPGTTTALVIRHVRKGCHVWSQGSVQTTTLHLSLRRHPRLQVRLDDSSLRVSRARYARLQILNRDIVAHELVQLAGPNLALRGHMMARTRQLITFAKPGVYHFRDEVVKMGPETKVTTIGRDNMLHLSVSVR